METDRLTPIFTWIKPCKNCPSNHGSDPETYEISRLPRKERIKFRFACAWRPKGDCNMNSKKLWYGIP